jgi:hypothetical protein
MAKKQTKRTIEIAGPIADDAMLSIEGYGITVFSPRYVDRINKRKSVVGGSTSIDLTAADVAYLRRALNGRK